MLAIVEDRSYSDVAAQLRVHYALRRLRGAAGDVLEMAGFLLRA